MRLRYGQTFWADRFRYSHLQDMTIRQVIEQINRLSKR